MPDARISTESELRDLYGDPSDVVKSKKVPQIDAATREVIEATPLAFLSTSSADGTCDVSPRGGPAGWLRVLDETTVAFPDLSGNKLLDSLSNIVANPHAGLLLVMPGRDDCVRIDGRAHLSTDPDLLASFGEVVRPPKVAVVVEIDNLFIHCTKAFRRSEVWNAETWHDRESLPSPAALLASMTSSDLDEGIVNTALDDGAAADLAAERPID